MDVAGGHGPLIASILKANRNMRGVLFDLVHLNAGRVPGAPAYLAVGALSAMFLLPAMGCDASPAKLTAEASTTPHDKPPAMASPEQGRRVIKLDAKPDAVALDTAKTAVLVVDMQNDFGSKGGMFDRAGVDISGIQKAVGPTARALAAARQAGIRIIYLKMGYRPDLSDLGPPGSVNRERHLRLHVGEEIDAPNGKKSRILIRDTWNTDILPELAPQAGDDVIYKTRFSGFYETDLDARLKRMGVRYLVVVGCTTSICVDSTVRDAMFRDYSCVLLADCMSEPIGHGLPRSNHDASLLSVEVLLGWVSDSDRFRDALR